jgi:hypothetical protein
MLVKIDIISFKDQLIETTKRGKLQKMQEEIERIKYYLENRESFCDAHLDRVVEKLKSKMLEEASKGEYKMTINFMFNHSEYNLKDKELENLMFNYIMDKIILLPDFKGVKIEKALYTYFVDWTGLMV